MHKPRIGNFFTGFLWAIAEKAHKVKKQVIKNRILKVPDLNGFLKQFLLKTVIISIIGKIVSDRQYLLSLKLHYYQILPLKIIPSYAEDIYLK